MSTRWKQDGTDRWTRECSGWLLTVDHWLNYRGTAERGDVIIDLVCSYSLRQAKTRTMAEFRRIEAAFRESLEEEACGDWEEDV